MPPPVLSTRPTGPYAVAFRSLVAYLKAHSSLSIVRNWRVWEGRNDDEVVPTPDQCPWVRLTPMILPAEYGPFGDVSVIGGTLNLRRANTPLKIGIETAVTDTNFEASALLWNSLDAALFPVDDVGIAKLGAILGNAGVSDLTLLQPALPTGLASYGGGLIVGDGAIKLDIELKL